MSNTPFNQPIALQIWDEKYKLVTPNPDIPDDLTVEDTWRRIAKACANSVPELYGFDHPFIVDPVLAQQREDDFYGVLEDFKMLPAGRITAGAGSGRNVTLFNCLAGSTLILTMEYGLTPIEQIAGQNVHILDGNGNWVISMINSFESQPIRTVVFTGGYNDRQSYSVDTTDNHRWLLEDNTEVTTDNLLTNMKLKTIIRKDVLHSDDYISGVQHGMVYGDGSKDYGSKYRIRLCGSKNSLSPFFSTWVKTTPPSLGGESIYFGTNGKDMKALPSGETVEYMTGFLRGWFATDGCVDTRDGKPSLACGKLEVTWLKQFGAIAGMEVAYSSKLASTTNYGQRNKEIFNVTFHKWTMIPEDFLMEHHLLNFKPSPMVWKVDSVFGLNDPEPVYCPSVPTTGSFQLGKGVHTKNCYVMGTIPDSMGGIFDMLKEAALTMQQGGGIGYDFSTLRPKNAPVKGVDADASGPLTFMDVWDAMCRTVMSAGSRRGAMMATMRCDHPDIEAFIEAKKDPLRLRMFNLSVLVTDAFMTAVKDDAMWNLHFTNRHGERRVYKTVRAKDLWTQIMRNTYDGAEPGVIFIDRINKQNNLWYMETIAATNPCGEQPLPPYGACLLGSLNLAKFVINPFTPAADMSPKALKAAIKSAVRLLDSVIDISLFPIPEQKAEAKAKRRMGIGVTGLADALLMMGVVYGSDKAAELTEQIMKDLAIAAYEESIELAKLYGPCPATYTLEQRQKFIMSGFMKNMPHRVKDGIIQWGIRNTHLMSIAPTGTISLYAGNISSGVEPIFAPSYTRKVLNKDGTKREEKVEDYAVQLYRATIDHDENNPIPALVSAQTLDPLSHLKMQAAAQKWVDSSISKTINLPEDISFEDFEQVYWLAYEMGCKGCTTYRPNAITGSILSVDKLVPAADTPPVLIDAEHRNMLAGRPDVLEGSTYKIKTGSDHAMYVSMTYTIENGQKRPFEVFLNSKNMEHFAWTVALTRMISAIFRRGGDVSFVVEELKAVFDPRGGSWIKGKYVPSDAAAIGGVIEQFMKEINYIPGEVEIVPEVNQAQVIEKVELCPKCHSSNMKNESGCMACGDCGHSKCG